MRPGSDGGFDCTTIVRGHSADSPVLSVAVNVTTNVPTCADVGVHEKVLLTGLPLVGNGGDIVAPSGRPTTFRVTISPGSPSDAWTINFKMLPATTVSILPHVGVGGWSN